MKEKFMKVCEWYDDVIDVTPHKIKASTMTAKVLSSCVSNSIP